MVGARQNVMECMNAKIRMVMVINPAKITSAKIVLEVMIAKM